MLKLILVALLSISTTLFAGEIFTKDTEQFKATINYDNTDNKNTKIVINATPKKGWHINDGFPASVKPETTCLQFDKKKYKKKDAKIINENQLKFEIPTKCDAKGKKELKARIILGVCTDEICKRVEFKVDVALKSKSPLKEPKAKESPKKEKEVIKKTNKK